MLVVSPFIHLRVVGGGGVRGVGAGAGRAVGVFAYCVPRGDLFAGAFDACAGGGGAGGGGGVRFFGVEDGGVCGVPVSLVP